MLYLIHLITPLPNFRVICTLEDKEEAIPIYSGISLAWFYRVLQNVGHIQPILQEIGTNN